MIVSVSRNLKARAILNEVIGVVHLGYAETKMQHTRQGDDLAMMENVVVADNSSTIRATFWDDHFFCQLKEGTTYRFTDMRVDVWKGKHKVVAKKETKTTELTDYEEGFGKAKESIIEEKCAKRISHVCDVVRYLASPNCKLKATELSTLSLVKCANEKCG